MLFLALALVGAVFGGGLALWRAPRLPRCWLLLAIAAVPQLAVIRGMYLEILSLISIAAIAAWYWLNRDIAGIAIMTVGALLNLMVMVYHGGAMPIHQETMQALGYPSPAGTVLGGSKDVVVASSGLWWLADWLVVSLGDRVIVFSPGDTLLVGGIVRWLLSSRTSERSRVHAQPHPAPTR